MKQFYFILFFLLGVIRSTAQTPKTVALTDSLIKTGTYKVALTTYEFAPEIKILQDSVIARLQKNPKWAGTNLIVMLENGDFWDLKYMDEYGITRDEYNKMATAFKKRKQPIYSKPIAISIKKVNGVFTFQTTGAASLLNHLVINTRSNLISFGEKYMGEEYVSKYKFYASSFSGFETRTGDKINRSYKSKIKTNVGAVCIGFNEGDGQPAIILGIIKKDKPSDFARVEFLVFTIL
jgi:hypothetical protein